MQQLKFKVIQLFLTIVFVSFFLIGCNKTNETTNQTTRSESQRTADSIRTAKNDSITEKKEALFDNVKVLKPDSSKSATADKKSEKDEAKNEANEKVRSNLGKIFSDYISIKDELISSDSADAQRKAKGMLTTIINSQSEIGEKNVDKKWRLTADKIKKISEKIDAATTLENQRTMFNQLSEAMLLAIQEYGLNNVTVYHLTCNTALSGKGGVWLTDTKDSDNPYFDKVNTSTQTKSCVNIAGAWEFD